ncbi:MAG: penicillin acylase family protein [Trebonia sp.]
MDFQITRDGHGIPHVRAETAADAWAGMGYACAQDRLFQLDYDRRRACGRWAEIAGVGAVGADVLARRLGLAAAAQRDLAVMSAPLQASFEAYADGVNAAIADGALPLPGRYPVEPWRAWHSVAAFLVRHVLMGQWQHKLANAVLLARVGPAAFARLETRPPLGSPLAVPPGGLLSVPVSRLLDDALADIVGHLGFLAEVEPGSNAWAVSGQRTAHGGAVICNDSHRALDTPNVYWQCRVSCPSFDVVGATFPGLPGFPHFGFNGSVGWAITHADGDTQDLYLERFSGARYLTEDGWAAAESRQERINVRGGSPVTVPAWATRHGPIVHGSPESGIALALKWTGTYRANRGFECMPAMLTARSVAELCDAQDGWVDPVNNLVCADAAGRIAYQCRGEVPVRSSDRARRLPAAGWDGECEWTGSVPFAELPRAVDPDAGFVTTANNAIVDGDSPYLSYTFAQPFRAERLRSLLAGPGTLTVDSLAGMQADTVSLAARGWGRLLASLGPSGNEGAEAARSLLAGFDGDLAAGSAAAMLYACFLRALAAELYRPVLGTATWEWVASGALAPTASMVRRWLGNDTWELLGMPVPSGSGPLAAAWAAAVRAGGPDPGQWRWGDAHQAVRVHPYGPSRFASVPMGGDSDTIQAAGYGWRAGTPFTVSLLSVYRQVVDLASPDTASYVIPGGASGDPASPHFADQLGEWAAHRRIPMAPGGPAELEDDHLGADGQVLVVVVRVGDRQVDAAVRPVDQAAAVEGDAAGGEEGSPRHRLVVDVADEIRAGLPGDLEGAARGRVRGPRLARLHQHRPEADPAVRLQPGDVPGQVNARGGRGRAVLAVLGGERHRSRCGRRVHDHRMPDYGRGRVGPAGGGRGSSDVRADRPGEPGPRQQAARRAGRRDGREDSGDRHRGRGQRGDTKPSGRAAGSGRGQQAAPSGHWPA